MRLRDIGFAILLPVLAAWPASLADSEPRAASLPWKNPAPKTAASGSAALELQVELNRLGSSGDPVEREALLRDMIDNCGGTEEAEAAYWSLSDLYLDAFPEPRIQEARDILELFLKRCPDSRYTVQAKCRLLTLYEAKDKRAGELRRELGADKGLPQMLRSALKL